MLFEHLGARPRIDPTAVIAETAVISGDVEIGPDCQVLHGAVITAEGGPITLAACVIVMENAVIRATSADAVHIGDHTLIGPGATVSGAVIGSEVFLATGTARGSATAARFGSVRSCTCARHFHPRRLCRSPGSRWGIRSDCIHQTGTTRSGPRRRNSISRATSSASTATHPT